MHGTALELRRALVSEGIVAETASPPPQAASERPWFVSVVSGFSGWLAGLLLVWLVAMLFEPRGASGWLIAGLVSLGSAYGLYWADKESEFFDQLALVLSIAGQVAVSAAIADVVKGTASTFAFIAILQMGVVAVMPNRFAKGLAAAFAVIAWSLSVRFGWWERGTWDLRMQVDLLPALLSWILIWAPVAAIGTILVERESAWMASRFRDHARPILIGLLIALSFGTVASQPIAALQIFMRDGSHVVNWLVMWPLLSVCAAAYALVLALRVRSRALAGGAVVAMLMHIGHFYYLFGTTLIVKSIVMIALGAVMLLAARSMTASREVQS